jgi:hypothetical protein
MKKTTLLAIIIAITTITYTSCEWFNHSNKKPFSIIGKWKVDSIYKTGKNNDSIQLFITAMTAGSNNAFRFNDDSTFNYLSPKDSTEKKYFLKDSVLYFKDSNDFVPNKISIKSDSSFSFINKDSVIFVLIKQ